jgi:hypothetical protein
MGAAQAQWYAGAGYGSFDDPEWWYAKSGAVQIFGGYEFNDYLATELSLTRSGNVTCCGYDGGNYTLVTPWVVGKLPLGNFSLFLKAGYTWWMLNDDYEDMDKWDVIAGVGAQYNFSDKFGVRLERQRSDFSFNSDGIEDGQITIDLVSLVYRF